MNDGLMEMMEMMEMMKWWNDEMMKWWTDGRMDRWNDGMMEWWNDGIASIDHFWSCFFWFLKQQLSCVRAVGVRQEIQISIISRKMTWKSPTVTLIIKTEKIMIKIKLLIIYPNSLFLLLRKIEGQSMIGKSWQAFFKCHFTIRLTLKFKIWLLCWYEPGWSRLCLCVCGLVSGNRIYLHFTAYIHGNTGIKPREITTASIKHIYSWYCH